MTNKRNKTIFKETLKCPCCEQWTEREVELEDIDVSINFYLDKNKDGDYHLTYERVFLLSEDGIIENDELFELFYKGETTFTTLREAISEIRKLSTKLGKKGTFYSLKNMYSSNKSNEIFSRIGDKLKADDLEKIANDLQDDELKKLYLKMDR